MESLSTEATFFLGGFLAAIGVSSLVYAVIFTGRLKAHKADVDLWGKISQDLKNEADKLKNEYTNLVVNYGKSESQVIVLKKTNEGLREQVRIQAEKALDYKAEIEALKSNKPRYEKREKPVEVKKEAKTNRRGNNLRGADGKWVKNIGQTVEKKAPATLGL